VPPCLIFPFGCLFFPSVRQSRAAKLLFFSVSTHSQTFQPRFRLFHVHKNFGGQDCVCSSPSLKSSWLCFHGFFRLNVPQIYNFFATRLLKPFSYLKSFSAFNKLLHKERLPPSFREKDGLRKPPVPQKGGVNPTEGISEQGFPPFRGGERGLGNGFGGGTGKKKWATRRRPPIFKIKIKYNPYLPNEKDNTFFGVMSGVGLSSSYGARNHCSVFGFASNDVESVGQRVAGIHRPTRKRMDGHSTERLVAVYAERIAMHLYLQSI